MVFSIEEFEQIVRHTLESLPPEFQRKLDNIEILVEEWPTQEELQRINATPDTTLLGLYQGVPHTARGRYSFALPDKVTIFAGPILQMSESADDAREQIKETVLHEIGHHFGLSDEQIDRALHNSE
jgi:predicted Zn-dependent protease with MMP-like domain